MKKNHAASFADIAFGVLVYLIWLFPVSSQAAEITALDFQLGEKGSAKLLVTFSGKVTEPSIVINPRSITLDFSLASLNSGLANNYNVEDFNAVVNSFIAEDREGYTRIELLTRSPTVLTSVIIDRQLILTLDEKEYLDREAVVHSDYIGEPLSLNFQDIQVRSVLQIIADFTGLNLVTSDSVTGNITLRLKDVPWDQALALILKTKGLGQQKIGNVLMIAPADEIAERELQAIESRQQLQDLSPLQTEIIHIRYATASDIYALLSEQASIDMGVEISGVSSALLSSRGRIVVDQRTNALLVTETEDNIEIFRQLIEQIDSPLRQVMVEARIVVANDNFDQQIGVRWGGGAAQQGNGDRFGVGGSLESLSNQAGSGDELSSVFDFANGNASLRFPEANFVDLGVSEALGQPQSIAVGFLSDNFALNAELSAIAAEGRGEIISQPRIITGDKQEAEIKSGEEIPYVESSASGRSTIKFREAVLSLSVRPSITADNRLILDLVIKQDSRSEDKVYGENNSQVPIILKNEIRTQALVDNGKTIVLGGIFRESELEQETKVPLLGDIPLLGRLFKRTIVGHQKNELLIFITPKILTDSVLD
mgnify:FL=1